MLVGEQQHTAAAAAVTEARQENEAGTVQRQERAGEVVGLARRGRCVFELPKFSNQGRCSPTST